MSRANILALFDVDGTLTKPRNEITEEMRQTITNLRKKVTVGVLGGSDLAKIKEQLGATTITDYDYVFSENGLVFYKDGTLQAIKSIKDELGEEKLKKLINFILIYIANLDIPKKRGTFIEFRNGMLNVSPIGRNCNQQERDEYEVYDKQNGIRVKLVEDLKREFHDLPLTYSIGGQISIDIFPTGWDKTFCLQYLDSFPEIYFFGDKTFKGGNDYEIFNHPRVKGNTVTSPEHTAQLLHQIFGPF